jgi:sugar lactone lactonase YvrE
VLVVAEPRVLLSGIAFGESPRWHDGRLWFSDWATGEVIAVDLAGASEVIARVPSFPFCLDFLPDGRLLVMSGGDGRLLSRRRDGSLVTHADLRSLGRYPWNEVVADRRGNVWVNNIGFDFPGGAVAPGTIALVRPDGSVGEAAGGVEFPNGMVVTPDDATLILAESYGKRLTAFDIGSDGSLSNRRVWADLDGGCPDGVCLDASGAVWYADVPNRRCVRVQQGGQVLDTIAIDRGCFSCALGGSDGKTLFIVAAEWAGSGGLAAMIASRRGQLLTVAVDVPAAIR